MNDLAKVDLQEGLPSDDASPTIRLKRGDGTWKSLEEIQKEAVRIVILVKGGSMSDAARTLGMGRSTLYRWFPHGEVL